MREHDAFKDLFANAGLAMDFERFELAAFDHTANGVHRISPKVVERKRTMAVVYAEICQGEDPWIALGNFMNDWFDDAKDRREQLVTDPLSIPEPLTLDLHRWVAFCAASVEWL